MTRIPHAAPLLLLFAAPAHAQDAPLDPVAAAGPLDPADLSRDRITIGAGIATLPSYEGSDSNRLIPLIAARGTIAGYAFEARGPRLHVDAIRNRPGPVWDVQAGPVIALNLDRTRRSRIDDARVEALGGVRTAIELGGFVGLGKTGVVTSDYDKVSVSVSYVRDVNGAHDSYLLTPGIDYGTPLSPRAFVGLSARANYAGAGYARSYFGVTPAGALASGLPAFAAGRGWKDWSLAGVATFALTGDLLHGLGLVAGARYGRLLNDAARSPVVSVAGDRDQWSGTIGLAYTF